MGLPGVRRGHLWRPVALGTKTGVDLSLSSGQRQDVGLPSLARRGAGKRGPTVGTNTLDSPICTGSGTFPDIVNNLVLDELTYVCATCGASMPNFELAPVHRHALHRAAVLKVRLDAPVGVNPTTEMDELCAIVKRSHRPWVTLAPVAEA